MARFQAKIPPKLQSLLNGDGLREAVARALNDTADAAVELLAQATPGDTGNTRLRWRVAKYATPSDLTVLIENDSEVAVYLEYGTGIYSEYPGAPKQIIKPKHAKALGPVNWMGHEGVYFAWIRGMRPNFTVRRTMPKIRQLLAENVKAELRGMMNG
jgi:hypothetical protein